MNMLAQMSWFQWFFGAGIIAVCALLMLIVLIQRGRGQGLAGAFGGGGGGGGAFGAKTGDVFTLITVGLAVVFLFLNVVGNFAFDQTPARAPAATADTTLPATPTDTVPAEDFKPSITFEGTTDTGEPLELKLDGPFGSADDAKKAAEGGSAADPGSETPKAADQPDAKTDDPGKKTEEPGAGGESGGGSDEG